MQRRKVLIMGAAGRDFHNFNVVFRDNPRYQVVAFTAAQIPNIEGRWYPPALAGRLYTEGIPIFAESDLERLITEYAIDHVVFSYSDVAHEDVMHCASRAVALGADFCMLGARSTMLPAKRPVISVCAVRTGCGKTPTARKVAAILRAEGLRVAVVRHPMPYGDLARQVVQRFAKLEDLSKANCTIEEREEYEPHIAGGDVVYAGVDYEKVLRLAESEADIIVWDGGNNDIPFFLPNLEIVLIDPHRAGHERSYYPGEVNLRRANVVVLVKLDTANDCDVDAVRRSIHEINPHATLIDSAMPVQVDNPTIIRGKRVLVVEDGPTLTHGKMGFGAGVLAANKHGAKALVDPRRAAVGSIRHTFAAHPHIAHLLPAMGYGTEQVHELEATIARVDCDLVVVATPVDLGRIIHIRQPTCRVTYELEEIGRPSLHEVIRSFLPSQVQRV
jgi:predicted GTPase